MSVYRVFYNERGERHSYDYEASCMGDALAMFSSDWPDKWPISVVQL